MRRAALSMLAAATVVFALMGGACADESLPARMLANGAQLALPRPSVLPCKHYSSYELRAHRPPPGGGTTTIQWRRFRLPVSGMGSKPLSLSAGELPLIATLTNTSPIVSADLSLHCGRASESPDLYEPGVEWECDAAGCHTRAIYTLGRGKTRFDHLRLCFGEGKPCESPRRDTLPAFGDRNAALSLALAIVADARVTAEHICTDNHACTPAVLALREPIGAALAAKWSVLSHAAEALPGHANTHGRVRMRAAGGPFTLELDCNQTAHCTVELARDGKRVFYYMPVAGDTMPEQRLEFNGGLVDTSLIESDAPFDQDGESTYALMDAALDLR